MNGRGQFRLAAGSRVVVLPTCSRCRKFSPQCRCGRPTISVETHPRTREAT